MSILRLLLPVLLFFSSIASLPLLASSREIAPLTIQQRLEQVPITTVGKLALWPLGKQNTQLSSVGGGLSLPYPLTRASRPGN